MTTRSLLLELQSALETRITLSIVTGRLNLIELYAKNYWFLFHSLSCTVNRLDWCRRQVQWGLAHLLFTDESKQSLNIDPRHVLNFKDEGTRNLTNLGYEISLFCERGFMVLAGIIKNDRAPSCILSVLPLCE
ncbi:hypothetical protein TNCV_921311 [Trichonephila clavipes]|nr:hypothetical protein TNCV_921311 [Trichonephila clavipes]